MKSTNLPLRVLCPETGDHKTVRVPMSLVLKVLKLGPQHKFFELRGDGKPDLSGSCVQDVLLAPEAIFGGVREHQLGGVCYCGNPEQRWTNKGVRCPPPPGHVFVVYVNPGDEVYEWRWDEADERRLAYPRRWDDLRRFNEGVLWTKKT